MPVRLSSHRGMGRCLIPSIKAARSTKAKPSAWSGIPNRWKAYLLIDERKMDLIVAGHRVELRTSAERTRTYKGAIKSVSSEVVSSDINGAVGPQNQQRFYRAELELDEPIQIGFHGASAKANIIVAEQTLFEIGKRFLVESFQFGTIGF